MSLRDHLAGVLARDSRYTIQGYLFVFESLEHTKLLKRRAKRRGASATSAGRRPRRQKPQHVSGRELCEGARDLALRLYGMLALTVLAQWGIRSTSDLGNIVYNLIASGELEQSPEDSRAEFDDVFDFERALRQDYTLLLDDAA